MTKNSNIMYNVILELFIFLNYQMILKANQLNRLSTYRKIVSNYPSRTFTTYNIIAQNPHYQTIFGSEALRTKIFGPYPRQFSTKTIRWNTPDDDFIDLEYTTKNQESSSLVVILHGLESTSQSPLVTKMANAFLDKGLFVYMLNFRSCSGIDNKQLKAYHLGFTEDLNYVTRRLHEMYPKKKIYLAGYSLGGNAILKFLGELGDSAWARGVYGGVVTCVPFDPVASQTKIDSGFNRAVYSENFLQSLKKKAEVKHEKFPGSFDIEKVRNCSTIGDFDDLFIAKIFGFRDRVDYYRQSGSKWWLPKIRVPVVAINALDDPFIDTPSLPTPADIGPVAPVRVIYHPHGGHCGFVNLFSNEKTYVVPVDVDEEEEVVEVLAVSPTSATSGSNQQEDSRKKTEIGNRLAVSQAGSLANAKTAVVGGGLDREEVKTVSKKVTSANFIRNFIKNSIAPNLNFRPNPSHGWLAEEMSRALLHIDSSIERMN